MDGRVNWLAEAKRAAALIAVGLWVWSAWASPPTRVMAEPTEAGREVVSHTVEHDKLASECRASLEAWDSGERAEMVREHGGRAATVVAKCRSLGAQLAG